MTVRSLCICFAAFGLGACGDPSAPAADPGTPPEVANAVYVLRTVGGNHLPYPAVARSDLPVLLGDTIRFNIAYAARDLGPIALTRSALRDTGGRLVSEVNTYRYRQEGNALSFPPTCVPTENCTARFARGTVDATGVTIETVPPFRGPLRYERIR